MNALPKRELFHLSAIAFVFRVVWIRATEETENACHNQQTDYQLTAKNPRYVFALNPPKA
jgi:hypothetical protein